MVVVSVAVIHVQYAGKQQLTAYSSFVSAHTPSTLVVTLAVALVPVEA